MLSLFSKTIIFISLCVIAASTGVSTANAALNVDTDKLSTYIDKQLAAAGIRGGVLVITKGQDVVELHTYGKGITASTPFAVGSISKSFTALAIMKLHEQGKIDLDAPVQRYLPYFMLRDSEATKRITVRHLLNQTSGIPRVSGFLGLYNKTISLRDSIDELKDTKLDTNPGETFQYSNTNYTVLGMIIQQVSGVAYEEYMQENIFAPLGMTHTFTKRTDALKSGMATGHTNWFGLKIPLDDDVAPAVTPEGGLISSAEDISHYMIMLLNDGVYKGVRIISSEGLKQMFIPAIAIYDGTIPHSTSYAMGWGVGMHNNVNMISHDGDTQNFHANIGMFPDEATGVAVLVNENATLMGVGQTYFGVIEGLTTGDTPPLSHIYTIFYIIFDIIVVLSLMLMCYSLWRLRSWRRRIVKNANKRKMTFKRLAIISIGVDAGIAIIIYTVIFYGLGLPFAIMMYGVPDVTVWVITLIGFFTVSAFIKMYIFIFQQK